DEVRRVVAAHGGAAAAEGTEGGVRDVGQVDDLHASLARLVDGVADEVAFGADGDLRAGRRRHDLLPQKVGRARAVGRADDLVGALGVDQDAVATVAPVVDVGRLEDHVDPAVGV